MTREQHLQEFFKRHGIAPDSRTARIARRAGEFMWTACRNELKDRITAAEREAKTNRED